jgi:hypothetical protein
MSEPSAKLRGWLPPGRKRRRTVKYLCFGYYDKGKFDGMTESERNAMFDACFEYDDHLRANGHWGGGEALQGLKKRASRKLTCTFRDAIPQQQP